MRDDNLVKQVEVGNKRFSIYTDTDPLHPRKEWDNLGIIYAKHNSYILGDEDNGVLNGGESFKSWGEVKKALEDNGALNILPLYMYDHSGITISTTPFSCRWDSGQIGFIYTTKEKIKLMDTPKNRIEKCLIGEVRVYDEYLRGEVYGFVLEERKHCDTCGHTEWTEIDSCWGFYGDFETSGILENAPEEFKGKIA
jgi:hypothetical protein